MNWVNVITQPNCDHPWILLKFSKNFVLLYVQGEKLASLEEEAIRLCFVKLNYVLFD